MRLLRARAVRALAHGPDAQLHEHHARHAEDTAGVPHEGVHGLHADRDHAARGREVPADAELRNAVCCGASAEGVFGSSPGVQVHFQDPGGLGSQT